MSPKGNFSSCDSNDEKEVTHGIYVDIDGNPLIHSFFSKSPILDFEIYEPDPSHFVHTSLINDAQPNDLQDA